jgi:predicted dienelactone hydrolase
MKYLYHFGLLLLPVALSAQPYAIGSMSMTFYDADRDRDVPCELHYPAATGGDDVPVNDGAFPVIVIGHGFVMTVDAYTYLWEHYAPLGYIVVLPTTEAGFAPDHGAFGADLAFLGSAMTLANDDVASPFYQHVSPATVLMGHSMGGGAAFLGSASNAALRALITFAPAETNPSAVAAAALVQVPTLVFAASEDCVTPIADHSSPMYAALTVPCKAFVNITGGGHCYFGDDSFTCSFGELTCGPDLTISREQQHAVVTDITDLWLRYHVLDDATALSPLLDSLASTTRFIAESTCLSTSVWSGAGEASNLSASFTDGRLNIGGCIPGERLVLSDGTGRTCWSGRALSEGQTTVDVSLPFGMYVLGAESEDQRRTCRLVLAR